jgi:subfamily B ATP-binding cassette protein MsbA
VVVLLRKFGKAIRRSRRSSLEKQGNMVTNLSEVMKGQMVVKVHNAEGYEGRRFRKINKQMFQFMMKARMARAISSPVLKILSTCGMAMMAIVAAWLIFEYGIDPARFLTVLFLLAAAANSVKPLSKLHMQIAESQVGAERILSLLKEPTEPSNFRDGKDFPVLAQHSKSIEFKNITFTYPTGEQPAIEDVSLQVKHGQTVAVVGGNGSGKTTLLSLLPRLFEPQSGQILIDGRDIAEVRLRSLRQQMAVVTQKPVLFQGTIAQNIAYGHQYISRQKIEAAAKSAYADQFISELPDGYETKLGEDGVGLSGGQSQRLCIARAILREPLIMILDEATSQIDSDSENKINQAMRELRGGRTIFIIAHRLSTVIDADVIVVMDDGQIVDQGTHLELLGRCNAYKTLTQTQLQPPAA